MATLFLFSINFSARAVMSEDTTPIVFCMEGDRGIYKTKNAVPHDLGDPGKLCQKMYLMTQEILVSYVRSCTS